jgi:hypothetical protein
MSFIWTNSTKSGLCDRLIDLFIIASMAKIYNKDLYLTWEIQPINDIQKNIWNPIRFNDYKIENVKQYFHFPDCIHIVSNEELEYKKNNILLDDIIFNNYLGGIYSPVTFYQNFIDKKYNLDEYLNIFDNLIHQFQPTEKLLNLVQNIPNNLISVHLRRTDKSSIYVNSSDSHGVDLRDIEDLNNKTYYLINKFIEKNYHSIYFSSDCPDTKTHYENMYQNENIINYKINQDIEQTYVDIYLMSQSKFIILSQKHSSYSLFSSMINKSKFIYFYSDSIVHNNYSYLNNISLANNLII